MFDAGYHLQARLIDLHDLPIGGQIVQGHTPRREALFEAPSYLAPIELPDSADGIHGRNLVLHDIPGDVVLNDLGHRSTIERDYRGAASHRLDHHESERFGPIDCDQQRHRTAQEFGLFLVTDLADVFNQRSIQKWLDDMFVVVPIGIIDLGRDFQRYAASLSNTDGAIH